jgi:hypothetical protein
VTAEGQSRGFRSEIWAVVTEKESRVAREIDPVFQSRSFQVDKREMSVFTEKEFGQKITSSFKENYL